MKTIQIQLTNADENRLKRIRELRISPNSMYNPTDEEMIRTAIITYWQAAELKAEKLRKS